MDCLKISKTLRGPAPLRTITRDIKKNVIDWSKALSGNDTGLGNFDYHWVWASADGVHEMGFAKFGKEYYSDTHKYKDGHKGNNPNDMKPVIRTDGALLNFDFRFDHIFNFFEHVHHHCSEEVLETLGELIIRDAFMLDHKKAEDGNYYYCPPQEAVDLIVNAVPEFDGIDTELYLHYMDAIAQNEDVKYDTLGYNVYRSGYGRENNLLTYAHVIAALLDRVSFLKLCKEFAKVPVGICALTFKDLREVYPGLEITAPAEEDEAVEEVEAPTLF